MYAIIVYDVEADRTRHFRKLLRQYLSHVQNSVFEGEITEGDLELVRNELSGMLETGESVIVYEISSDKMVNRTVVGEDPMEDNRFL